MALQSPTPPDNAKSWRQQQGRPLRGEMPRHEEEQRDVFLRLKNGELANVQSALAERACLEDLLRIHPQHFKVLLSLSRGDAPDPTVPETTWRESVEFLKNETRDLRHDGTVRPLARNVLLSSYQVTPDGPVLSQPFALTSQQEKQLADAIDQRTDTHRAQFLRRLLEGDGPGPSR